MVRICNWVRGRGYAAATADRELAELKLSAIDRRRGGNTSEIARHLRDALETILSGNASLSFDMPPFWSGWSRTLRRHHQLKLVISTMS